MNYFELAESPSALCMDDSLGYSFSVEMGKQINEMEVLEENRTFRPNGL